MPPLLINMVCAGGYQFNKFRFVGMNDRALFWKIVFQDNRLLGLAGRINDTYI